MSDFLNRIAAYSPKRLALLANELKERADALEAAAHEPIAIVGMACRFPGGADTPELYWDLLRAGVDAVVETPADRWDVEALYDADPDAPGKLASRHGGFLQKIDGFDPGMFGIARREAQNMDPQQRLLLEVAWEALENAGVPASDLSQGSMGVFMGLSGFDYFQLLREGDRDALDAYAASGVAHSIASGRLAYILGARGPALSVDTACSSSLVATHLAVQSLRSGECDMALAGGVNLLLAPDTTIALSKSRMMAPDGRCKAFDERADGFVRGEGCGVLVLKRLTDAQAAGDPIVAVIRGSASNQDGRSNGLTAPNGAAQEALLRAALANARLDADAIGYVEAHGTGTKLGDPIEALALDAAYGKGRAASPILLGSVKANIGHLEAAAGVASVIKLALMLKHGEIPPQIHFETPNPHIPWDALSLKVSRDAAAWPGAGQGAPRAGGVSSFGFSGTNVHLILEQAPAPTPRPAAPERPLHVLAVSARDDAALTSLLTQYASTLSEPGIDLGAAAHTANAGRAHLPRRAAVLAGAPQEAADRLAALARGEEAAMTFRGTASARPPKVAFLFTGQGSQHLGMARELFQTQPVFRAALERCDAALGDVWPCRLLEVLFGEGPEAEARLQDTTYTQAALFAVEYALAELWLSWGVRPSAVAGHSLGEITAACVAGMLSLEDALRLVAARGRLMGALPRDGAMAAVMADEARVAAAVAPFKATVSIAAVNGPLNTVISGEAAAVERISQNLQAQGVTVTPLKVSHAFHSPLMEPVLEPFLAEAGRIVWRAPQIEVISNVTGAPLGAAGTEPAYWRDHVRAPVRFADSVAALARMGCNAFIEIGPHPTLLAMAQASLSDPDALWLPSLRRGADDHAVLLAAVAKLYVAGADIDWASMDAPFAPPKVRLPNYPFQRERFWVSGKGGQPAAATPKALHPLLGWEVRHSLGDDRLFETRLSLARQPYLADHRIHGATPSPSPVFMEMMLAAGRLALGQGGLVINDFELQAPLQLREDEDVTVQTIFSAVTGEVRISADGPSGWKIIATGKVAREEAAAPPAQSLSTLMASLPERISPETYYESLGRLGLDFGRLFRGVVELHRQDGESLGRVEAPDGLSPVDGCWVHPAVMDACLHVIGAAMPGAGAGLSDPFLLIAIQSLRVFGPAQGAVWAHVTLRDAAAAAEAEAVLADIGLFDSAGSPVARLEGVALKRARRSAYVGEPSAAAVRRLLYEIVWRPADTPDGPAIAQALEPDVQAAAASAALTAYADFFPKLDRLSALYVVKALRKLGWAMSPGAAVSARDLPNRLGVLPRHAKLFARMLDMLCEDGLLTRSGEMLSVAAPPPAEDPERFAEEILQAHPDCDAELVLTRRCGAALAEVLRGEADPLALLFPAGSFADTERLYQSSPPARVYNGLIAEAVAAIAKAGAGRPLRILEIGAGTGSTTAFVLSKLGDATFDYTFTDVSPLFLNRARERFSGAGNMRFELLDLEKDLAEQGFDPATYDIVIGANVVHATRDLAVSCAKLRSLLSAKGRLILLEGTSPQRFGDLTVGMLEGWWAFTDTDRRQYALMPRDSWRDILGKSGFTGVTALPETGRGPVLDQQAVFIASAEVAPPKLWFIQADSKGLAKKLEAALTAAGREVLVFSADDPALHERLRAARSAVGVVSLAALNRNAAADGQDQLAGQKALVAPMLELIRTLGGRNAVSKLHLVTRGAQAARPGEAAEPAQATLCGLSHVVALEHAELGCVRIDLDPAMDDDRAVEALTRELLSPKADDQIALRGQERLARRLESAGPAGRAPAPIAVDAEGAYLVTGGLRGLGLLVAEHLAERGARKIGLMGRAGPGKEAEAAIDRMRTAGAEVVVLQGDVANRADVARVVSALAPSGAPLAGVFHCAGVLDDGVLATQTWERFATVLAPKVQGAWNLHELCSDAGLFVMFSSGASVAGSAGQANHAAANAFEDALAWLRQAQGRPTLSINWGPWAEVGAAVDRTLGASAGFLRPMSSEDGLAALAACLWRPSGQGLFEPAQLAAFDADWSRLSAAGPALAASPLFWSIPAESKVEPDGGGAAKSAVSERDWRARIMAAPENRRRAVLGDEVRALAGRVLGAPARSVDIETPLRDMGLDSLMAVELRNRLGAAVGRTLPATITFDHPTVAALTAYLVNERVMDLAGEATAAAAVPEATTADQYENQTEAELAAALSAKLDALQLLKEPG